MNKFLLVILFGIGLSQYATAQSFIDKQGHRGCRGLMPENTIPAMITALTLGVNTLELDIVISKDKQAVVSHDPHILAEISLTREGKPISSGDEKQLVLYQMFYNDIRQYDVGSKFNPKFPDQQKMKTYKPLLTELIDSVEHYATEHHIPLPCYNIEIKSTPEGDGKLHPDPGEFSELVMTVINNKGIANRVIIQSFDVRPLQYIHNKYPAMRLAFLTANIKSAGNNIEALGFTPYAYSPYYKTMKKRTVSTCHSRNIKVIPWTVNTKKEIKAMVDLGADGIITDYPNLFKEMNLN